MTYARSKSIINKHALKNTERSTMNYIITKVSNKNLGEGSKAIGSAASVGNNVKLWFVFFLVNTNNKHRCIFAWGRNHNLLRTTLRKTKPQITLISNYSIVFRIK